MSVPQFLGYLAPLLGVLIVSATGWLKAHSAQKTAAAADTKATKALNGLTEHQDAAP